MNLRISIVIPVFNTPETKLRRCLASAAAQTQVGGLEGQTEIIVVDDCSQPPCKNIVQEFMQKGFVRYFRHWRNRGCLLARKTGIKKARGEFIVCLDADDEFLRPDACKIFYDMAMKEQADIVHCRIKSVFEDALVKYAASKPASKNAKMTGSLCGRDIFTSFFVKLEQTSFLWGKAIRRSLFMQAFRHIPDFYCIQDEDFLQYFFISLFAKKYVSIPEELYVYYLGEGISTEKEITNLARWKSVCTTARVSRILRDYVFLHHEMEEFIPRVTELEEFFLFSNLKRFHLSVSEDIKQRAWQMLCDAWGTNLAYNFNRQCDFERFMDK